MDARELRTGNLVLNSGIEEEVFNICEDEINVVYGGDMYGSIGTPMSQVEPIPLTEEWLERFGFEIRMKGYYVLEIENGFSICAYSLASGGYQCFLTSEEGDEISEHFDVHQLQNLYYALTAEELEI